MTGPFYQGVAASEPWVQPGSDADIYNAAIAAMFEPIYDLVYDQGSPDQPGSFVPGFGTLLNVNTCPTQYLPWLGQFVGVYVAPGTADATARALIKAEQGFVRGSGYGGSYTSSTAALPSPANGGAIVAAAQRNLVGTQSVSLVERTAASGGQDAYHFLLVVRGEELLWNLVPDPSFEYDTVGSTPSTWTFANCATDQVQSSWSASGSRSLRMTTTALSASQQASAATTFIAVQPAKAYSAGAVQNILSASGSDSAHQATYVQVNWYDASHTFISANLTSHATGITPGVYSLSGTFTSPSNAAYAVVELIVLNESGGPSALTVDLYWDSAFLIEGQPQFVTGDSGGFSWSGTPGNSATTSINQLTADVNLAKPGGVFWTLIQTDGWTISQMEAGYASITLLEAAFVTVTGLENDQVGA